MLTSPQVHFLLDPGNRKLSPENHVLSAGTHPVTVYDDHCRLFKEMFTIIMKYFETKKYRLCPKSSDPLYIVSYLIEWVTTYWTRVYDF